MHARQFQVQSQLQKADLISGKTTSFDKMAWHKDTKWRVLYSEVLLAIEPRKQIGRQ